MTNCMVRRNNLDVIHNINLRFREMQPPGYSVTLNGTSKPDQLLIPEGTLLLKFGINEILHSFHL